VIGRKPDSVQAAQQHWATQHVHGWRCKRFRRRSASD
jgi:hypothetical protein